MIIKKYRGNTLVEVLIALCVLGIIIPASLDGLGAILTASVRNSERTAMAAASERWFNRLGQEVSAMELSAAPTSEGGVRFEWEAQGISHGALRVTLRVYGQLSSVPYTASRIF